jgi:hypothetical protein
MPPRERVGPEMSHRRPDRSSHRKCGWLWGRDTIHRIRPNVEVPWIDFPWISLWPIYVTQPIEGIEASTVRLRGECG